jgi:hypothetical protein
MTFNSHSARAATIWPAANLAARRFLMMLVGLLLLFCTHVLALEMKDMRLNAGLEVFRSVLAADMNIRDKRGDDGSLLLVLIYRNDKKLAETVARNLEDAQRIHDIPIRVELATIDALSQYQNTPPAGIFLVQEIRDERETVVSFGKRHHIIVFSPFEGDVEDGIVGGIHISDRLLPYINIEAMKASNIKIKPFFLRVSKHYGG